MLHAGSHLILPSRTGLAVVTYALPAVRQELLRGRAPGVALAAPAYPAPLAAMLRAAAVRRPAWAAIQPGTLLGDLLLIAAPRADNRARLAALDRIVARIPWQPRSPQLWRSLARQAALAGQDIETIKRQEMRAAVFLVMGERSRPQRHRFGRHWLTDSHGRQQAVAPERLPLPLFWRWFQDEARKAAEASVTGQEYPLTSSPMLLDYPSLDAYSSSDLDPLEALIDEERRAETAARWEALLARATPGQRKLLQALAETESPTLSDAARRLDLAPSTARVHWKRLLDRIRSR